MDLNKCPLTAALRVVGGKWKPLIILSLRKSPKRFGQIDYLIPQISRKVLASHLAELVEDKLLTRQSYSEIPPRVEYDLTDKARELVPIFQALRDWGGIWLKRSKWRTNGSCKYLREAWEDIYFSTVC